MNLEARTIWQLRILMGIGVLVILFDLIEPMRLELGIPWYMSLYLVVASFYFVKNIQKMVVKRSDEMWTYFFFPGAFVTALIPAYAITLFLAMYT